MSTHNICFHAEIRKIFTGYPPYLDLWPAHARSLIRPFADRMCLLQPPGYPERDKREPLPYWVDVQADPSLCWSHRSYCRLCRALTHIINTYHNMQFHRLIWIVFFRIYSRTSMARTPLGPWKIVRAMGSSSQWRLIMAPGREANIANSGKSIDLRTTA